MLHMHSLLMRHGRSMYLHLSRKLPQAKSITPIQLRLAKRDREGSPHTLPQTSCTSHIITKPHFVHLIIRLHNLHPCPISCITSVRLLVCIRVQWITRIIPHSFHNPQSFRPAFPEQYPLAHSQVLGSLNKPKRHRRAVSGSDESLIDIDDRARLTDWADMQHGLIFCLNGGCVRKDKHLGNEFAVDFWRLVGLRQDDHAFANFLSSDPL